MEEFKDPRKTFGEALVEAGEKNDRIVALSADSSGGSGMKPFHEKFPDRHFEFGIMEQGIMGFASGLPLLLTVGTLSILGSGAIFAGKRFIAWRRGRPAA